MQIDIKQIFINTIGGLRAKQNKGVSLLSITAQRWTPIPKCVVNVPRAQTLNQLCLITTTVNMFTDYYPVSSEATGRTHTGQRADGNLYTASTFALTTYVASLQSWLVVESCYCRGFKGLRMHAFKGLEVMPDLKRSRNCSQRQLDIST